MKYFPFSLPGPEKKQKKIFLTKIIRVIWSPKSDFVLTKIIRVILVKSFLDQNYSSNFGQENFCGKFDCRITRGVILVTKDSVDTGLCRK